MLCFFLHDLSHIIEYSIEEFRERSLKSGKVRFNIPWNAYFNCSDGFSKLGPSLREARTIAIEMHLIDFLGIEINHEEYALKESKPVIDFIDDSHYIKSENKLSYLKDVIMKYYNKYNQDVIIKKLRNRFKAISLYSKGI